MLGLLNCAFVRFAGANAHRMFKTEYKYLAVAGIARSRCLFNCTDDTVGVFRLHGNVEACFQKKFGMVRGTAIKFVMAFLLPESFHFGNGHAFAASGL